MRQQVLGESDGVTNNYDTNAPGTEGSFIQFVVPEDWDTDVYYVCQNHAGMGNTANAGTVDTVIGGEGEDATITSANIHAGAGQIELIGSGLSEEFADGFLSSYTDGGITYSVNGSTDVPLSADDILSVNYSSSSGNLIVMLDYIDGHQLWIA